ncbi:MAG: hypothetical protein HQL78_11415 [Magnetococcales bacterium]|nr:hypothetical protein [Magnetococcales bacterium]MBF0420758.1 hypothetical protein [Magnetococcales bacterium]
MGLTKILLALATIVALGNVLLASGLKMDFGPGLYTTVLLVLAGLVLYFLKDVVKGYSLSSDGTSFGDTTGEPGTHTSTRPVQVIYHESAWKVVAKGRSLGMFKNAPIPAWIRTSDQREADYCGISNVPLPEKCSCVEIPERSELIVPPGLVYLIRT